MKTFLFLFLISLCTYSISSAQTPYYEWLGKSSNEITSSFGKPADIMNRDGRQMYTYITELGYQSFVLEKDTVIKVNMTTYWKTKGKAKSALGKVLEFYKKDGFTVNKKSDKLFNATMSSFLVKIETYYEEKFYAVSESATISKENQKVLQ